MPCPTPWARQNKAMTNTEQPARHDVLVHYTSAQGLEGILLRRLGKNIPVYCSAIPYRG
ncbi:MAG: hypothetical protein ACK5O1_05965 [Holosporales bacterium]